MCRPPDKVSSCRRDDDQVGFAREANVIEGVTGSENLGVDRTPANRFKRDWTHELARAASHHYVDFSTRLCKQTRQPH